MTPLLPLDTFRKTIAYHPWHFWGMSGTLAPVTSSCNSVVRKYAWQTADASGRDDISESIDVAERKLLTQLGFSIAPHYVIETQRLPTYPDVRSSKIGYVNSAAQWMDIQLKEGYVQEIGAETRTLIGNVTRSTPAVPGDTLKFYDYDGDGLYETFIATIATVVTDPNEIAVYFTAADRLQGDPVSEAYRIAPVKVVIAAGTATITGNVWLLVKPILYEGVSPTGLDPATLTNFVSTLAVYRHYCDPTGITTGTAQAMLIWETEPYPAWATCCNTNNSTDPAALAYSIARVGIRDSRRGACYIGGATWNASTGVWCGVDWALCRPPDRVEIRYLAGYPLDNGQIDQRYATITARLGCAELARRICACDVSNREIFRWQFDLTRMSGGADESYSAPAVDLENPFGQRRGHVEAWREVRALRHIKGILTI